MQSLAPCRGALAASFSPARAFSRALAQSWTAASACTHKALHPSARSPLAQVPVLQHAAGSHHAAQLTASRFRRRGRCVSIMVCCIKARPCELHRAPEPSGKVAWAKQAPAAPHSLHPPPPTQKRGSSCLCVRHMGLTHHKSGLMLLRRNMGAAAAPAGSSWPEELERCVIRSLLGVVRTSRGWPESNIAADRLLSSAAT